MQRIDLERRSKNYEAVVDMYKKLMKKIPDNRKSEIQNWIALKLSRFQFKIMKQPRSAIQTLQKMVKKDQSDARLFTQIIDISYQRTDIGNYYTVWKF